MLAWMLNVKNKICLSLPHGNNIIERGNYPYTGIKEMIIINKYSVM